MWMQVRYRWRRKEAGRVGWGDGSVVRALAALAEDLGAAPEVAVSGLSTVAWTPRYPAKPDVYPTQHGCSDQRFLYSKKVFSVPAPGASCLLTGTCTVHSLGLPGVQCSTARTRKPQQGPERMDLSKPQKSKEVGRKPPFRSIQLMLLPRGPRPL